MRNIRLAPDEHYHIFNRGVEKKTIFHDSRDYYRFLFLILSFQSSKPLKNLSRLLEDFVQHRVLHTKDEMLKNRMVELVAFCVMPNHFHLILKEVKEGGISAYMQRVLNAYGKYYNTRYEKSGHVFQGPYRAVHVESDKQLLYLATYIFRNPRELSQWLNKENKYPWSSYQDFITENRWGEFLMPGIILEQFKTSEKFCDFVESSPAKVVKEELAYLEDF